MSPGNLMPLAITVACALVPGDASADGSYLSPTAVVELLVPDKTGVVVQRTLRRAGIELLNVAGGWEFQSRPETVKAGFADRADGSLQTSYAVFQLDSTDQREHFLKLVRQGLRRTAKESCTSIQCSYAGPKWTATLTGPEPSGARRIFLGYTAASPNTPRRYGVCHRRAAKDRCREETSYETVPNGIGGLQRKEVSRQVCTADYDPYVCPQ